MAYDINFPADDSYLSDFPAGDREQNRALKDDQIVNAGRLRGLTVGNENGQIPINNGTENTNLNAALLNGKASSYFATSNHTHTTATQSSNGYMSNADKKKLDGIASGAEVNQNTFANVKVGSTTIQSDAKQDTLELAAGANISLVGDANNDKVTIGVTGKVASASQADNATKATNATNADVSKIVSNTAGDGSATDLVTGTMASNDYFRIRIGGSSDAGYAEIATADNGDEPIYIRQYGGLNYGFSGTPTRTATILDSSGNTSFPGTVTAPNFNGTATSANNLEIIGSLGYIKYGGGDVDENTAISQNKVNLLIGSWYSTGFRDLCSTGNPIRVAINHRNGNIKTTGNVIADGAMYTVTPATTDNSTRVATTAYVKNNISETLKKVYPVGSIYMSTVSTNPATLFGFGTWSAMPAGRVLLAQGTASWGTYNAGSTGGEATHQLTVGEIPAHNHSAAASATAGHSHDLFYYAYSGGGGFNPSRWSEYGFASYSHDVKGSSGQYRSMLGGVQMSSSGASSVSVTINPSGSSQAHNNMQPYIAVYMWQRTS